MKIFPVSLYNSSNNYKKFDNKENNNNDTNNNSLFSALDMQTVYNISFTRKDVPIYMINTDGSYKRYNSKNEASKDSGIKPTNISHCISGKSYTVNGQSVIKAADLETIDQNGNICIDRKKLNKCIKDINYNAVYIVKPDGSYKKYNKQTEAAEDIGTNASSIYNCLNGRYNTTNGISAIRACDLEIIDKNGNINIDRTKLNECIKNLTYNAIYIVQRNGSYKRYNSQKEAAEDMGTNVSSINNCLNGNMHSIKDTIAVRACDVETIDENGNINIDRKKLNKYIQALNYSALYVIKRDGSYKKYNKHTEAAEDIGTTASSINNCFNRNKHIIKGVAVVRACDIEIIDDEGNVCIDTTKYKEIMSCFK